jgi:galactose mutarotase-like enzyme
MAMADTLIPLRSAQLAAMIDPHGAQLSVLQDAAGRDLLWNGDPAIWAGRAPLLFPIVGALAGGKYRLGTHEYALPRHGFARGSRFALRDSDAAHATFLLAASDASRAVYPFEFELSVRYALEGATLEVRTELHNPGGAPLPASFGHHPAFRWPLPYGEARDAHRVEFEQDEPDPVRRLDAQGLLRPAGEPTPVRGRQLTPTDAMFEPDVLILDAVRSRSLTFGVAGRPRIRLDFPDSPYLGVWTKPKAPFLCIEPWHGIADPAGFSGDFTAKPGVFIVPPGTTRTMTLSITLTTS